MTLVAGVDSATQSCKVVVRELASGCVVRTGRAGHPDGTEVDPAAWWDALLAAVEGAGGLADVAAISVAGQQHGLVALNRVGQVIRPALLWNDTRSAAAAAALAGEVGAASAAESVVLPEVLDPAGARRATRGSLLPSETIVAAGAGDNAGAALGLGADVGDVVVSIGTSGTVFAVSDEQIHDESGTVTGFADASGRFLPLVATLNAARVLDAISGVLGEDYHGLGLLALAAEPGAGGLVLQPYFEGERTPNLPDATATLFGMTLANTTRSNLARAAIEGMLCGLADGLAAIGRHGLAAERVLMIGGAAQNPAVAAIAAQVMDVPVVVPSPGEYVALGAAAQAAWALTGSRPAWDVQISARPHADHRPAIAAQYAAYAGARA